MGGGAAAGDADVVGSLSSQAGEASAVGGSSVASLGQSPLTLGEPLLSAGQLGGGPYASDQAQYPPTQTVTFYGAGQQQQQELAEPRSIPTRRVSAPTQRALVSGAGSPRGAAGAFLPPPPVPAGAAVAGTAVTGNGYQRLH